MKLSTGDVRTLNRARTILADIEKAAQKEAVALMVTDERIPVGLGIADPMDFGRLAEAADRANEAIFNVLNVGKNHAKIPLTDGQLHNR